MFLQDSLEPVGVSLHRELKAGALDHVGLQLAVDKVLHAGRQQLAFSHQVRD